jgi:hypothetical protein
VKNGDKVWIVTHDDSLNDPILAVCATQDEAQHVKAEIAPSFPDGSVSLVAFRLGWRYDLGARPYHAGPG